MGTGAKIAIGCGCALVLGAAVVVGVLGVGAWWAKGKIEDASVGLAGLTAQAEEIDRFAQQANANPYTPPEGGVIPEPRLVKFLETRRQVHSVYERYESVLRDVQRKADSASDKLTLSELWSAGGALATAASEIRLAQMKALAGEGMSEAEYRDIQLAVYKSAWASEAETSSGQLPAEAVSESISQAAEQVREAVSSGVLSAREQGVPGAEQLSEADARRLQEGVQQLGEGAGQALHVPRANVELFRRHQAEIRKYAMNGLAFLGL